MALAERKAEVVFWQGNLTQGSGTVTPGSGAFLARCR